MAISLIPKKLYQKNKRKSKISVEWLRKNILPVAAVIIFFGASITYGYLFLYENTLSNRNSILQAEYNNMIQQVDGEERILASNFAIRAQELFALIKQRHSPSVLFELLENTTHPDVTFSSFTFSFKSGEIRVDGSVGGYNKLAEQILIWERDPAISGVKVSDFNIDTSGNLKFQATLILVEDAYVKS